jgi:Amt family ammonium transporter
LVAINTLLAAAAGGLISYLLENGLSETHSLFSISRGVIAGIVAASADLD